MSRRQKTAGDRLREQLDSQLARAGEDIGAQLEWTSQEEIVIARAVDAADRAEHLAGCWDALTANPETDPALLVKVSGELRALEKSINEMVYKVSMSEDRAKSTQHQRAAQSRWGTH
ncbi:hypothetical protein A5731_22630 [Mycolicibacterium conceptionense]|uniref:Uncharacterized protein n=1 Tax=Mycolicibacterium conceptionense TaxID=451644 RepID=A0A1A2V2H8_9MYCO|nr:hypothetical protein [Mycolicibacterium conceptionense]OBB10727.1 hypothetical protein A5718_07910 [Mycolicibacterium conceptionense]OBE98495.1 hypothetical protein A5731_22630 [Mycolicibacterium conceptionense]OBF15023.1 hypothetical protein A5726_22860 [Mycolicibacterium conceptionense]OBF30644.1 hypothetical protein A5720_29825 [Mycolicibacterium conceptionense]OBH94991.1 hypothetical protein A5716_23525 [Mycolicibacterium conceptionense]